MKMVAVTFPNGVYFGSAPPVYIIRMAPRDRLKYIQSGAK